MSIKFNLNQKYKKIFPKQTDQKRKQFFTFKPTFLYLTAHYNTKRVRLFRSFYIASFFSLSLSRDCKQALICNCYDVHLITCTTIYTKMMYVYLPQFMQVKCTISLLFFSNRKNKIKVQLEVSDQTCKTCLGGYHVHK